MVAGCLSRGRQCNGGPWWHQYNVVCAEVNLLPTPAKDFFLSSYSSVLVKGWVCLVQLVRAHCLEQMVAMEKFISHLKTKCKLLHIFLPNLEDATVMMLKNHCTICQCIQGVYILSRRVYFAKKFIMILVRFSSCHFCSVFCTQKFFQSIGP